MNQPRPLTRGWFRIADIAARLLALGCVLFAVAYPFLASEVAARHGQAPAWGAWFFASLVFVAAAVGAHGFLRRRPTALLLIALPAVLFLTDAHVMAAVCWLLAVVLLFAAPFALALREARAAPRRVD
ncbi:hypothetical protein [Agrilutibacter solisilvae]|uniref:Uncharacterized protein n=1 Tax=Agrilutibacter solisilvae TaxID=2763317 RepID=A0A974Y107_9GAMM|nr:hypothetical protein [Lysobacter solisilvae]QSX79421.1 hypothetical protein I8J32_006045 [Lysobacter solisilvae]